MAWVRRQYRSTPIAQEKGGEVLVNGAMFGTQVRGEFAHCEVAFFVGKNPWISHGFPHARSTLKEISADPARSIVVIDPRRTETAAIADFHLQVRPGRDAWLLAAMVAVVVQENLCAESWLAEHANGIDTVRAAFAHIDMAEYCAIAGVDEDLVRRATRRIARAASVAVFEDLGAQMNRHSTLGRRTPLVHREYDLPRPGEAEARRTGGAQDLYDRCRVPRTRRR